MKLKEETSFTAGTSLFHPIYGKCRIKYLYSDKNAFSFIIDNKPIGECADGWGYLENNKLFDHRGDSEFFVEEK